MMLLMVSSPEEKSLCGNLCSTAAAGPLVRLRLQSDVDVLRERNYNATHCFAGAGMQRVASKTFWTPKLAPRLEIYPNMLKVTLNYL